MTMIWDAHALADRLLCALANGLAQGLVLALLVALVLRLFRRINAATRYGIEFVTLLLVALLPAAHFLWRTPGLAEPIEVKANPGLPPPDPESSIAVSTPTPPPAPARAPADSFVGRVPHPSFHAPTGSGFAATDPGPASTTIGTVPSGFRHHEGLGTSPAPAAPTGAGVDDLGAPTSGWPRPAPPWRLTLPRGSSLLIVGLWAALAAGRLAALILQCRSLLRLKRAAAPADGPIAREFADLRDRCPLRRPVDLRFGTRPASPMVVGFFRPAVIIHPTLRDVSERERARILRHELAHVVRRDDWTNLAQQAIAAVLFFHPAVLWLAARLRLDREIACDDHVLASSDSPKEYALFLADFAGRYHGHPWTAAPAAWTNASQLKERIAMIMNRQRNTSPRLARTGAGLWTTLAGLVAAIGLETTPRVVFGQSTETGHPTPVVADTAITVDLADIAASEPTVDLDLVVDVTDAPDSETPKEPAPTREKRKARLSAVRPAPAQPPVPPTHAAAIPAPVPAPAPLAATVPPAPDATGPDTASLEHRLGRLEALVDSLLRRRESSAGSASESVVRRELELAKPNPRVRAAVIARAEPPKPPSSTFQPDDSSFRFQQSRFVDLSRLLEEVGREMERASKEAEKAIAQAGAAARAAQADANGVPDAARKAIEEHRRVLEKWAGRIEAQLGQLDAQMNRVEAQFDRWDEAFDEARTRAKEATSRTEEANARVRELERRQAQQEKERVRARERERRAIEERHDRYDSPPAQPSSEPATPGSTDLPPKRKE